MTNSQNILINLLKKSLFGFKIDIPADVDWRAVYNEAVFQSVVPLAFDGTAGIEIIPEDVYKDFKDYTISVLLKNDCVINEQKALVKLLEKNGFKYAVLKGTSVARLYNKPSLRTLGDIDILVKPDDYDSVKELMISKGYNLIEDGFNHFHCAFIRNDVSIELHHEMSEFPKTPICDELRVQLQKSLDCTERADESELGYTYSVLSPLYQAVSLLLHMERHISKDGLGLRQILDLGEFYASKPDFLKDEITSAFLKKYGLYKFAVISDNIVKKYFLDYKIDDTVADAVFDLSLKRGNFGVKRTEEESYENGIIKSNSSNILKKYYNYTKERAKITWDFARKHPKFARLGFIYIPTRYLFRRIVGKKEKVNIQKVFDSANETVSVYNSLEIYKD